MILIEMEADRITLQDIGWVLIAIFFCGVFIFLPFALGSFLLLFDGEWVGGGILLGVTLGGIIVGRRLGPQIGR